MIVSFLGCVVLSVDPPQIKFLAAIYGDMCVNLLM